MLEVTLISMLRNVKSGILRDWGILWGIVSVELVVRDSIILCERKHGVCSCGVSHEMANV
jgi:hypothetical protein